MSRLARLEVFEPRIVMSAAASAELTLDYSVDSAIDVELLAGTSTAASSLAAIRSRYGLIGAGQTVAVIDSGIAYDHTALGGGYGSAYRVVGGYDFAEGDSNPYDDGSAGGHGTHVAGILAASNSASSGVAPGVDLVSLRVFDDNGNGTMAGIEQALRWVHNNRLSFENPITTVNLSLGTQSNSTSASASAVLEDELAQLEADGIFISVAAGNNFATYKVAGLSYPASSSYVVAASSVDANGTLSSFSQRSSTSIAAPGRSITSTVPDYLGNKNGVTDDYASLSGTSMAAPYVAGGAVLIREAMTRVGIVGVNQDMIYSEMASTADTIYDSSTGQNYLRLNLTRALEAVMLYGAGSPDLSTLGLYNASSGTFYLRNSNTSGTANATFSYGPSKSSSYVSLVGDWNGDGIDTVGLYNPATGTFYLRNSNASGSSDLKFTFGQAGAGWTPIVGDWNGDGVDTVGLYNAATSTFYVRNSNTAGTPDSTFAYGCAGAGWRPIVGDWNGDGVETVGLYNPNASVFYLKNTLGGGFADVTLAYGAGGAGWTPLAGDWNGDGIDTVGLYSSGESVFYLRNSNTTGCADRMLGFGAAGAGWQPLVGSWSAGRTAGVASAGASAGEFASLACSELCVSDSNLAGAVAHALASMDNADEAPQPGVARDLVAEQHIVDSLYVASVRVVNPQALDHVDLASVAQESSAVLNESDLAAISRPADSPEASDRIFSEEALLDVFG
jgi:subtilisin family serine protease